MDSDLENVIKQFGEDVPESTSDTLLEFVQQIENFFVGILNVSKLDTYLGLAFPDCKEEGLCGFLRRKLGVADRKYDKVKERIFNLIQSILVQKKWRSDVNRFCLNFKEIANMYWKLPRETARVQQAALDCLISLYENFGDVLDHEEFASAQLYWDLLPSSEKSSFQPTVRGKMFHLMGVLSALGKDTYTKTESFMQLYGHILKTIEAQVTSSDAKIEVSILLGCMKGLDSLLKAYETNINLQDPTWVKFLDHLERIVDPNCSIIKVQGRAHLKRREFQRGALELVANHGSLLQEQLLKGYRQWFEDLLHWSKSLNADDNKIGRKAMYKFLESVVTHAKVIQQLDPDRNAEMVSFFKFFMERFKGVLSAKDANRIEMGIAIRGFGMLASLCSDQDQPLEMLELMMEHINAIIQELESTKVDRYSPILSILPTYLESVASILTSLKSEADSAKFPEKHLEPIKKLTVSIVRHFPDLSDNQRTYSHISVQKICDSLWHNHHTLCEPFMEQVYQQCLLHIVSCPTRAEIDILVESWKKSNPNSKKSAFGQLGLRSVLSYVRFWKLLLYRGSSDSDELKFDLLMKWILETISKLDLSINFEEPEQTDPSLDPFQGATATVIKDFQIFVNIVDFFQEMMRSERSLHRKFEKWIPIFSNEMLGYIKSNTFVSGFYKILSSIFDASRTTKYFEQETDTRRDLEKRLNIFFRDLGTKIREYRDDLLLAVLELWLSLPDALILSNLTALGQTLQTVFTTGRSFFPLAMKGLEALERWFFQTEFPVDEIAVIMNSIYPILKTYFSFSEATDEDPGPIQKVKETKLKDAIKKNTQFSRFVEDVTLKTTQRKILQVLGSFGQYLDIRDQPHSGLHNDERFLRYSIPFQDSKPEMYIDDLLPRVLELCENSVERQTRISACEFFHTICLYFIGMARVENPQNRLFKQTFEAMLRLGCDSDITVRQLFNPLCLQTVHYFTKRFSPYDAVLLGSLTDALAQHGDQSLRELAALGIGEYFLWCRRHRSSEDANAGKDVLKTILAMSTHASPDYRQGSVLAFNSIYRDFREENNLVNEFTFNLLYSFLTSLKLSKNLSPDSLLIRTTKQAVKHLERILICKKTSFNAALNSRQFKPWTAADASAQTPILRDVVDWLLTQGGNEATVYREECLRLTAVLLVLVEGYKTPEGFLTLWERKKGLQNWIQIAEDSLTRLDMENEVDKISFLDAASSFYKFLHDSEMLNKRLFTGSSGSKFLKLLIEVCIQIQNQSDELSKIRLVTILSKVEYAWDILTQSELTDLWCIALGLSKELSNIIDIQVTISLAKIIYSNSESNPISESLKTRCSPILLVEPVQDWSSSVQDQRSKDLHQAIWSRTMAEEKLMNAMLSSTDVKEYIKNLWLSTQAALFKQNNTPTGPTWEANDLSVTHKKILENYMVSAIHLGIGPEIIIQAAFDPTPISFKDKSFLLSTTKGRVFQKQLLSALVHSGSIFNFDILLREKPIVEVGELIQRLLELLKSDRPTRKKFGEMMFRKTLDNWKVISINCELSTTLKIFLGLIAVDIDACKNSLELGTWWNECILAGHLDLKQKACIFGYITIFSMSRNKKGVEKLVQTALRFVHEDLKPEEISWTEAEQYISYILRKLLKTLEQRPLLHLLLEGVVTIIQKISVWLKETPGGETSRSSPHPLYRMTKDILEKVVKLQQTDGDRKDMAVKIYKTIQGPQADRKFVECSSVWKTCLLPVVSSLNLNGTKKFFVEYIYDVIKKMGASTNTSNSNSNGSGSAQVYDLHLKVLTVNLLELMVYQTNSEFIKGKELANAYWRDATEQEKAQSQEKSEDERNRIVYQSIVRVCLNAIMKTTKPREDIRRPSFDFIEACYNTLVATLLVTKAEFKFCEKFFFPGKKLFENFIDTEVVYEFPVIIDEETYKAGVVSYRKKPSEKSPNPDLITLSQGAVADLFMDSILSGSSLAAEATMHDFTQTEALVQSEFYQRIYGSDLPGSLSEMEEIRLEWNEINEHSCMYAFVQTLKRMASLHEENKQEENFQWPKRLASILGDGTVHKNVKVFIVGGIVNTPSSLEPFAAELMEPIVQLILGDTFGTVKLNHFVQDIILTLLSWHKATSVKPEAESVTQLISYILASVRNEAISSRKDISKHFMQILENVVSLWTTNIGTIPSGAILAMCDAETRKNPMDEKSLPMLEAYMHILQGGQLPQAQVAEVMKLLKKAVSSRFKGVYTTAAKCIGLILKRMKSENVPEDVKEPIIASVVTKVINAKAKPSKFIDLVCSIQPNFPEIMIHIRDTLFELCQVQKLRGDLITLLPLLFQRLLVEAGSAEDTDMPMDIDNFLTPEKKCGDDFFVDIDGRGFFRNPCETEEELESGMDLMELLTKHSSQPLKLMKMKEWVSKAEFSEKVELKRKYVKCLHELYKLIVYESNLDKDFKEKTLSTKKDFLQVFTRLFDHPDEEIQGVVKGFWGDVFRERGQTPELLLEIFELIWDLKNPLNVCLGIILHRCALSPDYSVGIFPNHQGRDVFHPFQLDTSWRLRNSSFQPLFAESLSSVKNFGTLPRPLQNTLINQRRSVGRYGMNVLRATLANLQFTPTQEGRGEGGRGEGMGTRNSFMETNNEYAYATNDFRMESGTVARYYENSTLSAEGINNGTTFGGNDHHRGQGQSKPPSNNPILKLRRKFYPKKDYTFFATKTTEKRDQILEVAKDMERARVQGVQTVRSYRIGEIPDLEIQHSDLLNTLLKLAKLDRTIGQQFLLYLHGGFVHKMELQGRMSYLQKSKETFERIMKNSTPSFENTLPTLLLEICVHQSISLPLPRMLNVCRTMNSEKLGILQLEHELLNENENDPTSSKRTRVTTSSRTLEEDIWLGLAEMYKEIEEFDVLRNIFHGASSANATGGVKLVYEKIGEALHLEGLGYLDQALKLLEEAMLTQEENAEETTETAKMFLEDSMMQCISKLGNWDLLYQRTEDFAGALRPEDYLQDEKSVKRLMPMRMLAGMQLALRHIEVEGEDQSISNMNKFHELLENNLHTESGTQFFSDEYPFDLAMWLLVRNEIELGTHVPLKLERGYEEAVRLMRNINMTPVKQQKHFVVSLQQAMCVSDYLKWKRKVQDPKLVEEGSTKLVGNWRKHLSHKPVDLVGNDLIASHRDYLASKVGVSLQALDVQEDMLRMVQDFRVEQELWLTDLGVLGKNYFIAHNGLVRLRNAGLEDFKPIDFRKSMAKFVSSFPKVLERGDWSSRWCAVWRKLAKYSAHPGIADSKADMLNCLIEVVRNVDDENRGDENYLAQVIKTLNGGPQSTWASCVLAATKDLIRSCDLDTSQHPNSSDPSPASIHSVNASLYTKLFHLLKKVGDELVSSSSIRAEELAEKMLSCVVHGAQGGTPSDMLLLSNVFSLLKRFPSELNPVFDNLSKLVPTYMFLPWIDQLVTSYKCSPEVYPSFQSVILRLSVEYPQAFQLQYPEYLEDKNFKIFADALKALVIPSKLHKSNLNNILDSRTGEEVTKHLLEYQIFLTEILNNTKVFGNMHNQYASDMFEMVGRLFPDSQPISDKNARSVRAQLRTFADNLEGRERKGLANRKCHVNLNELSPFIAQFHFFEFASFERPGLYENFRRPRVDQHPLIVSFHPTAKVYMSLTRPMSFSFVTNDGKRVNFLAKMGDDLRQDRRMQQLFKMSNVLFQKDSAINQRDLSIQVYSCIPLTVDFGIIEMVGEVMSMKEMVLDTETQRKLCDQVRSENFRNWLIQTTEPQFRRRGDTEMYWNSAKMAGRQQAETAFDALSAKFPRYLLRDNIRKRSKNLKEFFSVRQNMIRSYSALCMVHWLLGIGDRHLENTLMSLTSGKVVGIDFGRAFGTSNYVIPIPEMVPFRLTPQIQGVMMPYTYKGLFRESCILTWNCLMDAQETILTVADVFIQEPSLDWLKLRKGSKTAEESEEDSDGNKAKRPSNENSIASTTTTSDSNDPFPFAIMKKKMVGCNPTKLLQEELKMLSWKDVSPVYCSIAENGRKNLEKEKLSTEEYIDVLLDLATDKNVLMRIFAGWNAWI